MTRKAFVNLPEDIRKHIEDISIPFSNSFIGKKLFGLNDFIRELPKRKDRSLMAAIYVHNRLCLLALWEKVLI